MNFLLLGFLSLGSIISIEFQTATWVEYVRTGDGVVYRLDQSSLRRAASGLVEVITEIDSSVLGATEGRSRLTWQIDCNGRSQTLVYEAEFDNTGTATFASEIPVAERQALGIPAGTTAERLWERVCSSPSGRATNAALDGA